MEKISSVIIELPDEFVNPEDQDSQSVGLVT